MFTKYLLARKAARNVRENAPDVEEQEEEVDMRSGAQKAADVFQRGIETMYKAAMQVVPTWRDDMSQDVREFCSPIATHVERTKALIKLERMSQTSIILALSILYTASFTCLASAIVLGVSWSRFQATTSTAADSACDIAFAAMILEGICRSVAVALLTFLTIFFPFRLLRYQVQNNGMAFQYEQILLIMFFILLMITPGMSIYSPILYWQQYTFALEHGPTLFHNNTLNLTLGESYAASFFSRTSTAAGVETATAVMSVLLISYALAYFGHTARAFGAKTTGTATRTFWATLHCLCFNRENRAMWIIAWGYSAIFIPLVIIFRMLPSVVPLMGIITVFKSTDKLSPHYDDGLGFQRAMVVSAQFVYEIIAFGYVHLISNAVRRKLKMTPYEQARPKHLGFRYYSSNKRMAIFFAMLSSIIVVSCMQESYSNNEIIMQPNGVLVMTASPLRQVGISFFTLGFGQFYLLLTSFLFAFAYAYLPPDSQSGIAAFFCGGARNILRHDMDKTHVYLATCKDVAAWREMQERNSSSSCTINLADAESIADSTECSKYQVNACVFCLETEILLLNLTYLSYLPPDVVKKQAQANKFRSVTHIFNKHSDIQCYVFERRAGEIFVTFRGTSSNINVWQDLDYFTTPAQMRPDEVEPVIDALDPFQRACAAHVPLVHRGFYKAYSTIREEVVSVLCTLIKSTPGGVAMYCCGHSLGGALATLFATDVGLRFQTDKARLLGVHLSTFGSPRVGNFAFTSRVARLVGTSHRFVVGGDPIPKLPPTVIFGDQTKLGYQHVGVVILLDVEKITLLIDPLMIERQIAHGWGGYSPQRHLTGTYVLSLLLWNARVHAEKFVPNWWLPIVNHMLRTERKRLKAVKEVYPMLAPSIVEQLEKDGAVHWTEDMRSFQTTGCETGDENKKNKEEEEEEGDSTQRKKKIDTVLAELGFTSIDELRNYLAKEC